MNERVVFIKSTPESLIFDDNETPLCNVKVDFPSTMKNDKSTKIQYIYIHT